MPGVPSESDQGTVVPKYEVASDAQMVVLQLWLPGTTSIASAALDILEDSVSFASIDPAAGAPTDPRPPTPSYAVEVKLDRRIDPDKASASFKRKKELLVVKMPVADGELYQPPSTSPPPPPTASDVSPPTAADTPGPKELGGALATEESVHGIGLAETPTRDIGATLSPPAPPSPQPAPAPVAAPVAPSAPTESSSPSPILNSRAGASTSTRGNNGSSGGVQGGMLCQQCGERLPKTAFSKPQLKKTGGKRRCISCVATATASAPSAAGASTPSPTAAPSPQPHPDASQPAAKVSKQSAKNTIARGAAATAAGAKKEGGLRASKKAAGSTKETLKAADDFVPVDEYVGTFRWGPEIPLPPLPPFAPGTAPGLGGWMEYLEVRLASTLQPGDDTIRVPHPSMMDGLSWPLTFLSGLRGLFASGALDPKEYLGVGKVLRVAVLGCSSRAEGRLLTESNYWDELVHFLAPTAVELWLIGPEIAPEAHLVKIRLGSRENCVAVQFRGGARDGITTLARQLSSANEAPSNPTTPSSGKGSTPSGKGGDSKTSTSGKGGRQRIANNGTSDGGEAIDAGALESLVVYIPNPGFGSGDAGLRASWVPELEFLLEHNLGIIVSCANDYLDLKGEQKVLKRLGARVVVAPKESPFNAVTEAQGEEGREGSWSCANSFVYAVRGRVV